MFVAFAFKSQANITYVLSYDAVGDKYTVSAVSDATYATVNIGPSYASLAFSPSYNTAAIVVTPVNGGAWAVSDKVTGNTGSLNTYKVVGFATTGAAIAGGMTAGTSYPMFTFTFGVGNNCGGTLRLYVNGVDPTDPNGAGGDFTSYLEINSIDYLSTNSDAGFKTCVQLELPVKFSDFTVVKRDNDAQLTWTVQNQDANAGRYDVERSYNGIDFTGIGSVPANLNATTVTYNYKDLAAISKRGSGIIYYRIKEINTDGQYSLTVVRTLRITNTTAVTLYPNPANDHTSLTIDLEAPQTIYITVTDGAGKEMRNLHIEGFAGINLSRIDVSKFAAGSYMVTVKIGGLTQTLGFVKQ